MFRRAFIRRPKAIAVVLGCAVGLMTAAAATADAVQPVVVGPIIVADGTVSATSSGGGSLQNATVTVNGQPASVEADGTIVANVDLDGQSTLTIAATNPATGTTTTTTIPVDLIGPGGVVPASVLDDLKNAGVAVTVPPGGFVSLPGTPVQVSGSVADEGTLAGLTVNGTDAMSLLQPDGAFSVSVPGTDKTVVVTATDKEGAAQSTGFAITPLSEASAASVTASAADGVRIVKVGYATKGVKAHKRIRVTLTVKDRLGRFIQGAKVGIRAAKFQHRLVVGTPAAKHTNRAGKVTFTLRLHAARFTHSRKLHTVATAATPSAKTTRGTLVRLPRLAGKAHRSVKH
jgi:hypothetical protein